MGEVAQAAKPIDANRAKESSQIVANTKAEVAKSKKDVVKTSVENTLQKQADSLIGYMETVRPNLKGSEIVSDMKKWLSDTNVRSLVDHLVKNNVYVADGAYGLSERSMVSHMKDEYKKNSDFREAMNAVHPILKSGVSADLAARDFTLKNNITTSPDSIISYLGNLHANAGDKVDGKGSATGMSGKLIAETLGNANKKGKLVEYVNQAMALSGSTKQFTDIQSLTNGLKDQESLKYSIIDGMNILWSMKELPGIQEGVSSKEKERLAKIDAKLKEAVAKSRAEAFKRATTPEEQKAVELAYADLANQVSRSDVQYGFGVVLSNKGIGAGAGLEKWLNDTNSLTVNAGLAGGNPVFEFGIKHEFMKTADSQLSGKAGVIAGGGFVIPFVEGTYTKAQWTTSLKLTPIGGMAAVSKELGNTGEVLSWMDSFKRKSPELANQLLKFSDVKTKASDVNFTRNTSDISKSDLPGFNAVSQDMNSMIRQILVLKKFDTMTDPNERYSLLVTSMTQVVQERQYRVHRDAATNGVSVTNAGVALGVFDAVPFVFPFVSFGANILEHKDVQETITHSKTEKLTADSLRTKYLTQAPEFVRGKDGALLQVKYSFKPDAIKLSDTTVKIAKDAKVSFDATANIVTFDAQPKISIVNGVLELSTIGEFSKAPPAVTSKIASTNKVSSISEARNKVSQELSHLLFFAGHSNEPAFKNIVQKISRQDFDGAKTLVEQLQKGKYKTLATSMLKAWDSVASFPTHMYGSASGRSKQEYTQAYVDARVRKSDTIRAEVALAKQSGISHATPEASLKMNPKEKYVAINTADMFPGQEMTIACFATPSPGLHRIDTYDASVSISAKKVMITDAGYKSDIVESTIKNVGPDSKGVLGQLKKLNTFLASNGVKEVVTLDQYKQYLITSDISKLGVAKLTSIKAPAFFEGRALIAGNVCVNRLHGIIYPTFELNGVTQGVTPPPQIDITETVSSSETTTIGGEAINTPINVSIATGWIGDKPVDTTTTPPGTTTGPTTQPGGDIVDGPVPTPGSVVVPPGGNTVVPILDKPTPVVTPAPSGPTTTPTPPTTTPPPNPFGI